MTTIVTRVTGATAKNAPLTSAELDTNFINLNNDKLETSWTGSTNIVTLGTIATGTWNATMIATNKGGTGLTSFTSGGAVYATSSSALTTGTLPVTSGGTGSTTATGTGSVVLATSPTLVTPTLGVASATSISTSGDITVGGNLIVNGSTTTVNSTTLTVDDKNIELGSVASPTNSTADGGGITLKGTTDKTFNWVNSTSAWTSSEHIDLAAGKNIYLRGSTSGNIVLAVPAVAGSNTVTFPATTGTVVTTGDTGTVTNTMLAGSIANSKLANSTISGIALGGSLNALTINNSGTGSTSGSTYNGSSAVTISYNSIGAAPAAGSSSITTVGTITTGTWSATNITLNAGGTNASLTAINGGIVYSTDTAMAITAAGTAGQVLISNGTSAPTWESFDALPSQTGNSGKYLTTNGTTASWQIVDTLPSQTGNSGKYLTTNGTTASWETVSAGIALSDDTSTNASYYPALFTTTSGSQTSSKVSSTKLYFNPSTGTLNSTIFNSLSDVNQKTNISNISNATNTINKIDSVEFDWKDNGKHSAGVVAQQLEQVLPFLVETSEQGVKSVNYSGLTAYLIQSIKELSARIKELENNV